MARYYASTNNVNWGIFYDVTEGKYSIENNTSPVGVNVYLYRPSSASYYGGTANISFTLNGETKSTSVYPSYPTNIGVGESNAHLMASFSYTVGHDSDGSKSVNFSLSWSANFTPSSASGSGSMVLTTIPRASEISSVSTANVGSNATITVNRKSSSFTHTITYSFGNLSGTIVTKSSNTSIAWTIPTTFYTQMSNDKTKTGTMTITTYNGNTQIGSSSTKSFSVTTNESACKPDVSGSVVDSNSTTIAITQDNSILIAGYSTASVSYSATPKNSASIKTIKVNNDSAYSGTSSSTVTGTKAISNFNASNIDIVTTDSRTYSNTKKLRAGTDYTLINYIPLTFSGSVSRQTPTGDVLLLSFSGKYYSGNLGNTVNSLTIVWKYREKGSSSWINGGTLTSGTDYTINTSNNTYSGTNVSLGSLFNYQKNYEIGIFYNDALVNTSVVLEGKRGIPIVNWGEDFFNVNGKITKNGVQVENGVEQSATSLDNFKTWLINTAPVGSYLVNLNMNGSITCAIVEKASSSYLSFIHFSYGINAKQYRYTNGTWTEVILEKYYDKYQTSEFKTNKTWINNKPIYRKVIETTQLVTNDTTIAHNISNVDRIWINKAFMTNNDGVTWDIPIDLYGVTSTSTDRVSVCVGKSVIQFKCDTTWDTWWTKTIILEYTKTTD